MRKWLGIGMLALMLSVALVGVGAYWLSTKTNGWTAKRQPDVVVRVAQNGDNEGDAEPSEVIEPLIVQRQETPVLEQAAGEFGGELARVVLEPGMDQPPRPDVEPGEVARMPYADEEAGVGFFFFLDWSVIKAKLGKLNTFKQTEKADPTEESENRPTNPPQAEPVPDYHQQYQHCPRYDGPCPMPYRSMPRD